MQARYLRSNSDRTPLAVSPLMLPCRPTADAAESRQYSLSIVKSCPDRSRSSVEQAVSRQVETASKKRRLVLAIERARLQRPEQRVGNGARLVPTAPMVARLSTFHRTLQSSKRSVASSREQAAKGDLSPRRQHVQSRLALAQGGHV